MFYDIIKCHSHTQNIEFHIGYCILNFKKKNKKRLRDAVIGRVTKILILDFTAGELFWQQRREVSEDEKTRGECITLLPLIF